MKKLLQLLPALLVFLLPIPLSAQSTAGEWDQTEIIERIINATGIAEGISSNPKEISAQFASNPFGLEPAKNELMIRLFEEAYGEGLLQHVRQTFNEQYNAEHARTTAKWLQKDPARRVHQAEQESYTLQGTRMQVVRRYEMEQEPPSKERQAVIESLIEATSATEAAVESQLILFRSIISAFSILSDQQNFSEAQIDGIVDNYRMQIQPQMQQEMNNQLLIMYYDINNEVLRDYISFYQTEAGRWLNTTTAEAVQAAYRTAGDRFIDSVTDANSN